MKISKEEIAIGAFMTFAVFVIGVSTLYIIGVLP